MSIILKVAEGVLYKIEVYMFLSPTFLLFITAFVEGACWLNIWRKDARNFRILTMNNKMDKSLSQ